MGPAQNDLEYQPDSTDAALADFEAAVAEYQRGRSSFDEAHYVLARARSQLDYARVCVDETDAELDVIATLFNLSHPEEPDYYALMAELDLVNGAMLRNSELLEEAVTRHQLASERYEAERSRNRESIEIANAMMVELSQVLEGLDTRAAANDPDFNAESLLYELSDAAYRYYRLSA